MSIPQHIHLLPSPPPSPADPSDSSLSRSSLDHAPPPHLPPSHPSNPAQRPLSRTRTILKFLTPKIRLTIPVPHLPSPSSPTSPGENKTLFAPRAPTPLDSQSAKEKRDAALRERGLLPPLKQNKDLSRQELEEDKRLPIASPVEKTAVTITSPTGTEMVSPADLIKMEWEAKNRSGEDDERDRFKSFKFGASSPLHESQEPRPSQQHVVCQEIISPQIRQDGLASSSDTRQIVVSGSAGRSQNSTDRDHELGQLSPALIPLPPSPSPTPPASPKLGTNLKLVSPCAINLCSPALVPLPPSPTDSTAKHGADETNLELVLSIPTDPAIPFISLSPVTEPKEEDAQGHQRKVSASESQSSSLATPSLETPSHSILGTADSSPRIKVGGKNIPMIVESPVDEGPGPELAIPNTIPEDSDVEAQQDPLDEYQVPKPRRKKRTLLFGRDPSKRLRVSASLTNMRRSVANTLSRTKSHLNVKRTKHDDTLDASHFPLPPSPTFPLTGSTWAGGRRSMEDAMTSTPRQPVSPTLHSHGSILLETSAIEDDEARRMTELAFLG